MLTMPQAIVQESQTIRKMNANRPCSAIQASPTGPRVAGIIVTCHMEDPVVILILLVLCLDTQNMFSVSQTGNSGRPKASDKSLFIRLAFPNFRMLFQFSRKWNSIS